uniref:Immunoglobulin V-set domain-containing protein n=1 Tax=Catagonus wagneri TaxID=51154 RepID=A0A8C3WG92_9CETA
TAWTPLLPLLTHCPGSSSQAVVTQEPSLTVSPGVTVTLPCGSHFGSSARAITTSNYADWVQQKPSQSPRDLIGDHAHRAPSVPEPFSGPLFGSKAALTKTGAQPEAGRFWMETYFAEGNDETVSQSVWLLD